MLLQMVCYMKYLPDPIWRQGVYNSITVHTPIFTAYVGTTKLTAIKLKTRSFNNMFFTHLNKQNAGVLGWPLKLLQSPYSKVRLTSSLPLRPNGRFFLAFNAPSQFFLWESCGLVRTLEVYNPRKEGVTDWVTKWAYSRLLSVISGHSHLLNAFLFSQHSHIHCDNNFIDLLNDVLFFFFSVLSICVWICSIANL